MDSFPLSDDANKPAPDGIASNEPRFHFAGRKPADTNRLYANPRSLLLGYLWADEAAAERSGIFVTGIRPSRTDLRGRSACGCQVIRRVNKDFYAAQISGVVFDLPLDRLPFDLAQASDAEIKSFCAAVIEGKAITTAGAG